MLEGNPQKPTSASELRYALNALKDSMHKFCIFVDAFEKCLELRGIVKYEKSN